MRGRHVTTAVTLLVLVGILVLAALYGVRTFLAPVPHHAAAAPSATCSAKSVRKGQRIHSRRVQVSVFNAGTHAGLATETMNDLRNRGFKPGTIGNAPSIKPKVKHARVFTTIKHDYAARLVALQFGIPTQVVVVPRDLGPGIDVVVGNDFHHLAVHAKQVIVVRRSASVCVPVPSAIPSQ